MTTSLHYASVTTFRRPASPISSAATQDFSGLRERTYYLISRAYQNLYGINLPSDEDYQQTLFNAALQLIQDPRATRLSEKLLLQAFENIIRISDEHTREARKHLSRASNPVYLRETALDNALEHQTYLQALDAMTPQNEVRVIKVEHTGRLSRHSAPRPDASELACQQLAASLEQPA